MTTHAVPGVGKRNTSSLLVGVELAVTAEISEAVPQRARNRSTVRSNCITLELILKGFFAVLIAALFVIARKQKQRRCPPTDEWVMVHLHSGIICLLRKINSSNLQVNGWNWKRLFWNTQIPKDKHLMFSLIWVYDLCIFRYICFLWFIYL